MKRISKLVIITFVITVSSIIIQGCCEENFKIIGKGDIGAYYGHYNELNKTDTVDRETTIHWQLEYSVASLSDFGLVQSCYATSCGQNFENELIESTLEISCDKDFEYNGKTIRQNTNFIEILELKVFVVKTYGGVEITLTEEFLAKTIFETSDYEFTVKIKTTDDKEFINSLMLHMKI